jgi:hypothetical protein
MPNRVGGEEPQDTREQFLNNYAHWLDQNIMKAIETKKMDELSMDNWVKTGGANLSGVLTPPQTFREQLKDSFRGNYWDW